MCRGHARLGGSNHNVLCIGRQASCGDRKKLDWIDAGLARFRDVPGRDRAWLLEKILHICYAHCGASNVDSITITL